MTAPPGLTDEQRAALDAPGREVAVAAGAGSGKTTLLVEAVWEDLEDGVGLDELLVAAYNRAAAAHLVTRLGERFADGRGPERASLDLSAAWIGTLHSLCGRIVREHPFLAGVDPELVEIDETEAASLVSAALDEAVEACEHEGFADLLASTWAADPVRDAARTALDRLRSAGHASPALIVPEPAGDPAAAAEAVRVAAAALGAHPKAKDAHTVAAQAALAMAEALVLPDVVPRAPLNCANDLKPSCYAFNDAVGVLRDGLVDRAAHRQLTGFAAFFALFRDRYAALKRSAGALDFEDLQLSALRVLRALPAGARHGFRRIYVDEYQDANPLQEEILTLLSAARDDCRTMVVGDACQSIYGFRHADPAHFMRRAGSPPRVTLRANHRSQQPLMRALNGWLGQALAEEPSFAPLDPRAGVAPGAPALRDPPVELIEVVGAGSDRAQEARALAGVVGEILDRGYAAREVAVLLRGLTHVSLYEAALRAAGIRTHLVSGRGFLDDEGVLDLEALLRVVENPHDEPALVRVLASPYVSASDDALAAVRAAAGAGGALWPAVSQVPEIAGAAGLVESLRAARRELGLAGLVDAATCAGGYDLAALGRDGGAQRYANLRKLVRMAAAVEAVRGPDLRAFLALVDQRRREELDPGEAVLVDRDLDAVRISTVHGVKGQELDVVVLADANLAPGGPGPIVRVDAEGRAAIRLQRPGERENRPALGYAELEEAARLAALAEERRVVYVALTRARRHVAVVGRAGARDRETSAYRILAPGLPAEEGVHLLGTGRVGRRVWVLEDAPPLDPFALPDLPEPSPGSPPALPPAPSSDRVARRRLSFSGLRAHAACSLRHRLEAELGLRGPSDVRVPGSGGTGGAGPWGGAVLGSLLHERLALHAWHGPAPAPGWCADAALAWGLPPSPAEAARGERLVAALLADPLATRIAAGRAHAERRMAFTVGPTLLTGSIDLMVEEPDGSALVIDWKSHDLGLRGAGASPQDAMGEYALQQAIYGLAALRAGHPRVELRWVFLDRLDAPQVRLVTAHDAPALEAEIAAALDSVRTTEPAPAATEPQWFCSGCPGLVALCPVAAAVRTAA